MELKEPIKIRKKLLKNGAESLYLDIYEKGQRRYEFLKLYLNPGNSPEIKRANRESMRAAEIIKAQRLVDMKCNAANIFVESARITVVDFWEQLARKKSQLWTVSLRRWKECHGTTMLLKDVKKKDVVDYLDHLGKVEYYAMTAINEKDISNHGITTYGLYKLIKEKHAAGESIADIARELGISYQRAYKHIKCETKYTHYSESYIAGMYHVMKSVFDSAVKKRILLYNPCDEIERYEKPVARTERVKVFLTIDEVKLLSETPCNDDTIKRAFLFACYTGLRYSDIVQLTWRTIDDSMVGKNQQKTKNAIYFTLSKSAIKWLPERKENTRPEQLVFNLPPTSAGVNSQLQVWVRNAGLDKHVSFHVSRHTCATLLLTYGADLYTVSKILGHKNITTTQIYAKIIDKKRDEALNLIPEV